MLVEIALLAFALFVGLLRECLGDAWRSEIVPFLPRSLRNRLDPPKPLIDPRTWERPGLLLPHWSQRVRFDSFDRMIDDTNQFARFPASVQLDSGAERRVMCRISLAHLRRFAKDMASGTIASQDSLPDMSAALGLLCRHLDCRAGSRVKKSLFRLLADSSQSGELPTEATIQWPSGEWSLLAPQDGTRLVIQ